MAGALAASGVFVPSVNLDGQVVTNVDAPAPVLAGIRVKSDGTVERALDASWSQVDAATDWIIPNGAASGDYEVRATEIAQTGGATRSGTTGSWLALSSTRTWTIQKEIGTGTATWDLTLEIRKGSTTLASGTYELTVTVL